MRAFVIFWIIFFNMFKPKYYGDLLEVSFVGHIDESCSPYWTKYNHWLLGKGLHSLISWCLIIGGCNWEKSITKSVLHQKKPLLLQITANACSLHERRWLLWPSATPTQLNLQWQCKILWVFPRHKCLLSTPDKV